MFYDSMTFKTLESGIQAMNLKQKIHNQNIANYETPDYKTKSISFQDILAGTRTEDGNGKYHFQATINTETDTFARPDGNNVDIEKESMELLQTFYQASAIYTKINGQFTNMRNVLTQASFK